MGSDVGQIFPTASLHRDHSILYALVCQKELSQMDKNSGNSDQVCKKKKCDVSQFVYKQSKLLVLSARSGSDFIFCLQSYQGRKIDGPLVY